MNNQDEHNYDSILPARPHPADCRGRFGSAKYRNLGTAIAADGVRCPILEKGIPNVSGVKSAMTWQSQAAATLNSLPFFAQGSHSIDCQEAGQQLHCELIAHDTLACAFERFELQSAVLATAEIDRLKTVAESLSRRLTYLLEPISPVEVDAGQCVVQLRSNPPQRDDNGASYYELLVQRGGRLSLCRWLKEPGAVRRAVPAQVTREVFLRLVADFSAAAS